MDPNVVEIVPLDMPYVGKLPTWLVERVAFLSVGHDVLKHRGNAEERPESWIAPPKGQTRIQLKLRQDGQLYNSGYIEYAEGKGLVHRDWSIRTVLETPGMRYVTKWLHIWSPLKAQEIKDTYMHCNVCYSHVGNPIVNFLDSKIMKAVPKGKKEPYLPGIARPDSWIEVNENSSEFLKRLGTDPSKWAREMVKMGVVPPSVDATPGERLQGWLCNLAAASHDRGYNQASKDLGYHPIAELMEVREVDRPTLKHFIAIALEGSTVVNREIVYVNDYVNDWHMDSFRFKEPGTPWTGKTPTHYMRFPSGFYAAMEDKRRAEAKLQPLPPKDWTVSLNPS